MKHHTDGPSPRPTPAQRLAGAAGRLTGLRARKGERRGSVLVLILGGLALLSVVAVVYVTVGQSDRRTGATTRSRDSVQDTAQGVASYLSGVIGDDALATFVDGQDPQLLAAGATTDAVLVREAHDYPSTDFTLRTHAPGNNVLPSYEQFNPVGSYDTIWTTGIDLRTPTDPWLASPEPTYLLGPTAAAPPPNEGFTFRLDWAQVSNPAPSGNPVNLYNLRANFDAAPGFSPNPFNPPPNNAKMSDRLSLFDANNFPNNLAGAGGRVTTLGFDPGRVADPLRPAHWTTFQVGAFRPARDVDVGPEDARYLHYQWADADGDGYFDARWFELVDISDPDNPFSVLPKDDRFRWFIAPRIIDLSGRINLNTATDFRNPPDAAAVAGMTPADLDLLRVLRMDDAAARYQLNGQPLDYAAVAAGLEITGLDPLLAIVRQEYTNNGRTAVGHYAYDGLRIALRDFSVPPYGAAIHQPPLQQIALNAQQRAEYYRRAGARGDGASLGSFVTGTPPNTPVFTGGGVFGQADLLELLAHGGLNEPGEPSRLESAVGGRFVPAVGGNAQTGQLSPLRDNWPLMLERGRIDDNPPGPDGLADDEALAMRALDPRLLLTTHSGGRPIVSQVIAPNAAGQLSVTRDLKVDAATALNEASPTTGQSDPSRLFAAYCDALLPHSWREDAWDHNIPLPRPKFPLAYGADPVLALFYAAHLTANAIDMYDRDGATALSDKHEPSPFTLAVSGDSAILQQLPTLALNFPYWSARGSFATPREGVLDLDWALRLPGADQPNVNPALSRMARQGDLPAGREAMNVFGIEAQPFIVEVASITIYTDAPHSAYSDPTDPGAEEWVDPGFPPTIPPNPINIDGSVTASNPDILCQVLAFQITNPFDVDIGLSQADASVTNGTPVPDNVYTDYYIEFGNEYFKLAQIPVGGGLQQVVLSRRDNSATDRDNTRVFYVLNDTLENIVDRFEAASPPELTNNNPPVDADDLRQVIHQQLSMVFPTSGTILQPILIPRMDPATGANQSGFVDFFDGPPESKRVVKLWRKIDPAAVGGTASTPENLDDLLVDRLNDSADTSMPPTLDRRLPAQENDVSGTQAGPCPTGPNAGASPDDNIGFSIMLWASIKRMDDPGARDPATGAPIIPRGALPAYCIEPRPGWATATLFQNEANGSGATPQPQLRDCDFGLTTCTPQRVNSVGMETLHALPDSLTTRAGATNFLIVPTGSTTRSYMNTAPEEKTNNQLNTYDQRYPEIHLNDARFEVGTPPNVSVTLRTADMLLPMAVGPTRLGVTTPDHSEWLTLGESIAVSIGYLDPPAADPNYGFLNGLGVPAANWPNGKLDRGHVRFDTPAPWEDLNNNGQFDPEERRWPGVPLSLRILDMFTTAPRELGTLEQATPGVVNVNTASPGVLLALPMLQPNRATSVTGTPAMWWGTSIPGGQNLPLATATDIASSLEAYRDKLEVENVYGNPVRFDDTNRPALDEPSLWDGRDETHPLLALRQGPGLASIGELLCLTGSGANANRVPPQGRFNSLAADGFDNGAPGVDSITYPAIGTTPAQTDGIADDFDEQLTMAAAVTNTVSVRSDVFAVWFVLHGYQRSDTEGLSSTAGSADPLTPTIAKRYLMIVDRSNVSRKGDKPRILMMQELPL